jgi:hypothetical protein
MMPTPPTLPRFHLPLTLAAWQSQPDSFAATLKQELAGHAKELPLQQALAHSSAVADGAPEIMLLATQMLANSLEVKIGVFFQGIVAGCNCADDPTPVEPLAEYCELRLVIDRTTAATSLQLVA